MKKIIYTLFLLVFVINTNAQVQLVSGGTGAAYTLTYPGVVTLTPGISITFKANVANTGAATINVNLTGAVAINKNSNQPLVAGDIAADQFVTLIYDGTKFQMVTPSSAPSGFANSSLSNLIATAVNQNLIPNANNARSLGSNTLAWDNVWLGGKLYIGGAPWTNTAANNTLIGTKGGEAFTTGLYNLGVGQGSGNSITTGERNTVVGHRAGELLTTQTDNTFVGNLAGGLATGVGNNNTFLGSYAGYSGSNIGSTNTFLGYNVGSSNTSGSNNTYVGGYSAYNATSGSFNTIVGNDAGQNLTTGGNNTFLGYNTGLTTATQRTNAAAIGYNATVDADNAMVLGNNANVGIGISQPAKLVGSTRYLSVAGTQLGVTNGTAALELIGNTGSYNTVASKIDFLGLMPVTDVATQRARIEARSGTSITSAGQLTFWTNDGANAASIYERMRITEAGRVGIGTVNPATTSLFAVGAGSQFQVSSSGNLVMVNNVPMSWPAANAAGVFQNDGTGALSWAPVSNTAWSLIGNSGTVDGTNFIGTNDNIPFNIRVNGQKSARITSVGQTFFGYLAGANNTGSSSTAFGTNALAAASAVGTNTAIGYNSMTATTTGNQNVAVGYNSMVSNLSGSNNVVMGYVAMGASTSGSQNVAIGQGSLAGTTNTSNNTAVGHQALYNSNGNNNTSLGYQAGLSNTTGANNLFLGYNADASVNSLTNATAIGYNSIVSQSNALILGNGANVGIGTSLPTFDLSFGGDAGRDIGMVRNTVANTAGNFLRIEAGGATVASTNRVGGTLNLASGISTGNSGSIINFLTATPGTIGTTDNLQSIKMTINGNGDVGVGVTTPQTKLDVNGDVSLRTGATIALGASFTIDLTVNPYTYLRLSCGANVTSFGGTSITGGSVIGQILILENTSNTTITFVDNSNVQLNGNVGYVMGVFDTLTLLWNGTDWIEIARSNN